MDFDILFKALGSKHRILDLHQMTISVEEEAEVVRLRMNSGKTKMISLGTRPSSHINISSQPVEKLESFQYRIVFIEGGTVQDLIYRIIKAKVVYGMLSKILRNYSISLRTKLLLFLTNIESVLLYGCST